MNWFVSQLGAREEYAAARAFAARGELRALFTDLWCHAGADILARGPTFARAVAAHRHPGVPGGLVRGWPAAALANRVAQKLRRRDWEQIFDDHLRYGAWFDRRVARRLRRAAGPGDALFAFNTSCLESLRAVNANGGRAIVDQIDPARTEQEIVEEERRKWPGWEATPGRVPGRYFDRLTAEWDAAGVVVVNSEWSADALERQGVPRAKLAVVPLAYEPPPAPPARSAPRGRPLTVLWLGSVILRKGFPYFLEAARLLPGVRFVVAGRVELTQLAVKSAPANVGFAGPLTRDRVPAAFLDADVFALPTLSDGFALTQLEAMAHGLPVVATPRCGRVVTDGVDGFIVPRGDGAALASALARFDADRSLVEAMSAAALRRSRDFSLAAYGDALRRAAA